MYATNGSSSAFLSNSNTTSDATVTFNGKQYTVPAWSVTILPDGQSEEYNTAKVCDISIQYTIFLKELQIMFFFSTGLQ